jgi:hypothetical protein
MPSATARDPPPPAVSRRRATPDAGAHKREGQPRTPRQKG